MAPTIFPPIAEVTSNDEEASGTQFNLNIASPHAKSRFGQPTYRNQVLSSRRMDEEPTITALRQSQPGSSGLAELDATSAVREAEAIAASTDADPSNSRTHVSIGRSGKSSLQTLLANGDSSIVDDEITAQGQRLRRTHLHSQRTPNSATGSSPLHGLPDSSDSPQFYSENVAPQQIISVHGSTSQVATKRLFDVLSHATFLDALDNPPVRHRLHMFAQTTQCSEFMSFLDQVRYHKKVVDESFKAMAEIDAQYLSPSSDSHIDLSSPTHEDLRADVNTVMTETLPSVGSMFNDAEDAVKNAIFTTVYPDFVRAQLVLSTLEALGSDRHRYQGLGDCFCLTDPSKADNPILFASDGFVAVTGYERKEVIPRNCRFLQGPQTDRSSVRRVRDCIQKGKESVEFLLNYRKNGEPFWNLLYVAPLFDANGQVAFFMGGQINCSSSIHGKPDVMRVLATSHDSETSNLNTDARDNPATVLIRRVDQLKALKYRQKADVQDEAGMERRLVAGNEPIDSVTRIERFYSAYSKYLVVKYPSMIINFSSKGIEEVLRTNDKNSINSALVGANVFKFLKQHMLSRDKSDWKHRIEVALKSGRAISVALNLQTKRSMVFRGDERFVTHWTPLKNVDGATQWAVVCLCPMIE